MKPPIDIFGIDGRYASALYSAAFKKKTLVKVEKDLASLQAAVKQNPVIREFLKNPFMKRCEKASLLMSAGCDSKFQHETIFLLEVLAENGRLQKLNGIINAFKLMMSAHRGEVVCEVITAKPLDDCQSKAVEQKLKVSCFF